MPLVQNLSRKPLQVHLFGGKKLHLNPGGTGNVSTRTTELASFKKLIDEGVIELTGDGNSSGGQSSTQKTVGVATHGNPPQARTSKRGDR